jgi:predicted HTH domain antitoxin
MSENWLKAFAAHDQAIAEAKQIEKACQLYAGGIVSRKVATRIAGLSRSQFDRECRARQIPRQLPERRPDKQQQPKGQ